MQTLRNRLTQRYYKLRGISFFAMMFLAFIMVLGPLPLLLAPILTRYDKKRRVFNYYASLWGWLITKPFFRVKLRNRHHLPKRSTKRPVIFVANHTSHTDVWALHRLWRTMAFLSKQYVLDTPVIGLWSRLRGDVPVNIECSVSRQLAYETVRQRLRDGMDVVIFPEGTRSFDGRLGSFFNGAFRLAVEEQLDIVPITICGAHEIAPRGTIELRPGKIDLVIHAPISPRGKNVDILKREARQAIASALPKNLVPGDCYEDDQDAPTVTPASVCRIRMA